MKLFVLPLLLFCSTTLFAAADYSIENKLAQQPINQTRAQQAIKDIDGLLILPLHKLAGQSSEAALAPVKALRQQALEALQKGDYALTVKLAEQAKMQYILAARNATPASVRTERLEAEYKQRLSQVEHLMEALKTTGKEYRKNVSDTENKANQLLREARQQASSKKYEEAKDVLDRAASYINGTMSAITKGAMLTAPKDESPKGIYEYLLFCNDTYRGMIEYITDPKNKFAIATDSEFLNNIKQGDVIRKEALAIAEKKRWEEAGKRMVDSSSFYKKSARAAGMPIQDSYD